MVDQQRDGSARSGVAMWFCVALAALVAVETAFAFVGLDRSSFWYDELYTVGVAGKPSFAEALAAARLDVHPPTYYVVAHLWGRAFGYDESGLRLLSAALCACAAAVLVFGTRRVLSPPARLVVGAVATTSLFWFEMTQNARSYGLVLFALTVVACASLKLVADPARSAGRGVLPVLFAASLVASATHAYAFIAAECSLFYLFVFGPSRHRVAMAVAGGLLLGTTGLITWSSVASTSYDIHRTWFSLDPTFLFEHTRDGVRYAVNKFSALLVLLAAGAFAIGGVRDAGAPRPRAVEMGFLAFTIIGVPLGGLLASYMLAPSYAARNLSVVAPYAFLLIGYVFDAGWGRVRGGWAAAFAAATLAVLLANGAIARQRFGPWREEFRAAAGYAARVDGCARSKLAVLVAPGTKDAAQDWRYAYSHYLPGRALVAVDPLSAVGAARLRGIAAERKRMGDRCGVLLVAVRTSNRSIGRISDAVARAAGEHRVVAFPHYNPYGRFAPMSDAFVLLALGTAYDRRPNGLRTGS